MDPQATLALINEHGCAQALQDLAEWLAKDGFPPEGKITFPEDYRDAGLTDLAAAVNVALAYGDRTGLQGLGYTIIGEAR